MDEHGHSYRVVVADDSWHYAEALATALTRMPDVDVVGVAYSAEEALEVVRATLPDVLLLDLQLPLAGGLAVCEAIRDTDVDTSVVIVTMDESPDSLRRCLSAGAMGYVVKADATDPQRIAQALRAAADGNAYIDRTIADAVRSIAAVGPPPGEDLGLTPREVDVLRLVSSGLANKVIALHLHMSVQNVKNHLNRAYPKLGVTNRTQAAIAARERGIVGE